MRPFLFILTAEQTKARRQCLVVDVRHDDRWPEIIVPCDVKGKNRNNDHDRFNGRHDNQTVNLETVCPVNRRRFIQRLGDALHEVADEENIEHT